MIRVILWSSFFLLILFNYVLSVLLEEIANLSEDKKELSSQLQYQIEQLHKQLVDQESAAEESERRHEAAIEERNQAVEDLKLQLENVEKLLKANKAFVEVSRDNRSLLIISHVILLLLSLLIPSY